MVIKPPSLCELEKIEEDKLLLHLESLNLSYKNRNKKDFVSALTDIIYDTTSPGLVTEGDKGKSMDSFLNLKSQKARRSHSVDNAEDLEYDLKLKSKFLDNGTSISSSASTHSQSNKIENIICQNLNFTDQSLKLIIIGDKAVGKTKFINNLCEENVREVKINENHKEYIPTKSLEMKRFNFTSLKKLVKIELWDTNVNILASPIIKTYFKICNGFILLCDIANYESVKYLEKQIEILLNMLKVNDNIIIFANIKDDTNTEFFHLNLAYLKGFEEKFAIKVNLVNCNETQISKLQKFSKFIDQCLIKKTGKSQRNSVTRSFGSDDKEAKKDIKKEVCTIRDSSASPRKNKEKCIIF